MHFGLRADRWSQFGVALMGYAVVYPVLGLLLGMAFPRMPLFGVPCPTTAFTLGILLWIRPLQPRLYVIPVLWSIIAFTAALQLGVLQDIGLLLAAAVSVISLTTDVVRRRRAAAHDHKLRPAT